ncbi:MAG: beta-L-arabinofuranosidase domain-containing protein [Vicinamibacterales bacterium]
MMRKAISGVLLGFSLLAASSAQQKVSDYPIQPVPLSAVKVTGGFWQAKLETNRTVTIPHIMAQNESTGRVDNFRKGAGFMPGEYIGRRFNDTDIYKVVEAASYALAAGPNPALQTKLDELIVLIGKSQQADGYLFPARTINPAKPAAGVGLERWEHENTGSHELYNSGHLIDAAVAHFVATGQRSLLNIAIKNADLIDRTFGPDKRKDAPGHEVIEMALVRLYRATGDVRYFNLAKFFVDQRGTDHNASKNYTEQSWLLYNDRAYRQDDKPVIEQTKVQGHAVRAVYLYSAMADIAGMLQDKPYTVAISRLWDDLYSKRVYVTGGMGSLGGTESFADDYVLANRTAYTETCASVGGILWNYRMFLKSGDVKYLDAFEQTLYNGLLSGVSVKGDTFFYQNPLEATSRGGARSAYFDVACCPANLARLIAQLPGLIYSQRSTGSGPEVFVNLYVDSEATVKIGAATVHVTQKTNYPWDGKVALDVTSDRPVNFTLKMRAPGWVSDSPFGTDLYRFVTPAKEQPTWGVFDSGGQGVPTGGWFSVNVSISPAAVAQRVPVRAHVNLPMTVRRIVAHANVKDDIGKSAIQRGPVVYAIEGVDNGAALTDLAIPMASVFTENFRADLLGGVQTLTTTVKGADGATRTVTAIPYFAWANRGRGEMIVWAKQ